MLVALMVLGWVVLSIVVFHPLFLLAGARLLRVTGATYKRMLVASLLLTGAQVVLGALHVALAAVLGPMPLLELLLAAIWLVTAVWIVKRCLAASLGRAIGAWVVMVALSVGLAFGVRATALEAFVIPADSMGPTLVNGDRVLVEKVTPGLRPIGRGEVVVFRAPPIPWREIPGSTHLRTVPPGLRPEIAYVKRVAAVGGDTIEIRGGKLLVNGAAVAEPWVYHSGAPAYGSEGALLWNCGPIKVPSDSLFLLGDNRDGAYDSRLGGCVKAGKVIGRVGLIYWSREPPRNWYGWQGHVRGAERPKWYSAPDRLRIGRIGLVR